MRLVALVPEAHGGHGGIAQYDRDLVEALASHARVEEVLVLPRLLRDPPGALPPGVRYDTRGVGGKARYVGAVARALAAPRGAALVVCGHLNLLPAAFVAAKRYRAPLALFLYGIDAWTPPPGRMGALAARLLPAVDHLASISETTLARYRAWAGPARARTHILPNAFSPAAFGPGPAPAALLERYGLAGRTVLMTLGRMEASERYKGFDEVMEAWPRLVAAHPARRLAYLAVGDGTDRQRLQEKARALGLGADVIFTGRIDESEKAAHYRLADAYVMPSYGEGFGFVFLEAMACGVPVVASRADGSREAVRDGQLGLLVGDPKDPDELVAAVSAALRLPRGLVPEGLSYFEWPAFERRVHAFVDAAARGA